MPDLRRILAAARERVLASTPVVLTARLVMRPFESLPSRIILSVFASALVTSLAVAWISTQSIRSFLDAEIDRKFPLELQRAAGRLDLWYARRQLDIQTFASSTTVTENVAALAGNQRSARARRARDELEKYLGFVLERFPQYASLFLLDPDGRTLLWIGEPIDLSAEFLAHLAARETPEAGRVILIDERPAQIISAPTAGSGDRILGSLHAAVKLSSLDPLLREEALGDSGEIFIVAPGGGYLSHTRDGDAREHWGRPLPQHGAAPVVETYTLPTGREVVGSSLRFSRFGWTLVVEEDYAEAFAPVMATIARTLAMNLGIVVVFGLIAFQIARSVVRPIRALSAAARRIADGDRDVELPASKRRDEIGLLTQVLGEMTSRLSRKNQELVRVNEILEQLSITDDLTRLHNHRFFQDHLRREMKRAIRSQQPLSLILLDIDNFKALNDRFGHAAGDTVLREIGDVMNSQIRGTDLLARYGGEEFALLASQSALEGAVTLAEKIRLAISEHAFCVEDEDERITSLEITVSVGVSQFDGDEKAFFNEADRALYRAKDSGKNCVMVAGG